MNHITAVGQQHRPRQCLDQLRRLPRRQRLAIEIFGQTASLYEFKFTVGMSVGLADFVDLHNVGVNQPRHRLRFETKTCPFVVTGIPRPASSLKPRYASAPDSAPCKPHPCRLVPERREFRNREPLVFAIRDRRQ